MSEEFKWDDESIVVHSVSAIAVYSNPAGNIVIRQEDPMGGEDQLVIVPQDRAEQIVDAIHRELAALREEAEQQ